MKPRKKQSRGNYRYKDHYKRALVEVAEENGITESALVITAINSRWPEVLRRAKEYLKEKQDGDSKATGS